MDEYEIYDKAIVDFFTITLAGESSPVPIVFATGHRAFQRLTYLYGENDVRKRIKCPVMAIIRGDSTPADDRYRFNPDVKVKAYFAGDEHLDRFSVAFYPKPIDISYTLDVKVNKEPTMSEIRKQVLLKFYKDLAYIRVDLGEYGFQKLSLKIDSFNDASELEAGDQDIKIRESATLQLRGWLFRETTQIPVVKKVRVFYYDEQDETQPLDGTEYYYIP